MTPRHAIPAPSVSRRTLTGEAMLIRMETDIAELFAERRYVLTTDLIALGWSRHQVHQFQSILERENHARNS
jgi:hypothetical protein